MQSFAVIESYLDGCNFNEVGCGCIFPWAGKKGMDERTQQKYRKEEKD